MNSDTALTWTIAAILGAFVVGNLVATQTRRYQDKHVLNFWQKVGLPMGTERINASVTRRLRRSSTASALGGVAGYLVSLGILLLSPTPANTIAYTWVVALPAILIGATIFDVALAMRDTLFAQPDGTTRMARATAVFLRDYITPWKLYAPPVLLGLATSMVAISATLDGTDASALATSLASTSLPALVTAVLVLLGCAVAVRKILGQPQPVSGVLELAWDDALRADTVRKAGLLATSMSWLALAAAASGLVAAVDSSLTSTMWFTNVQILLSWGFIAITMVYTYGSSFNWFRRRLWPELLPCNAGTAGNA